MFLPVCFSNLKEISEKIWRLYIQSMLNTTKLSFFFLYLLTIGFLRPLRCVRITLNFINEKYDESIATCHASSYNHIKFHNKIDSHVLELDMTHNNNKIFSQPDIAMSIDTNQKNIIIGDQNMKSDTSVESQNDSIDASSNEDLNNNMYYGGEGVEYQNNLEILKATNITDKESGSIDETTDKQPPSFSPNKSSLIFDYNDAYMIRSLCFDGLNNERLTEIHLNIKDITKSNIDIIMCRECLNILCYGWNYCIPGLNNENFLDFIWFFHDLSCYSESEALDIFYKNLLPFLFSYIADKSSLNVFNSQNFDFSNYRNIFLPFLPVVYDLIEVSFDLTTKELVFIEKKEFRKYNLFGLESTEEIIIRTTPKALNIMQEADASNIKYLVCKLVCSFQIYGIRISGDNIYHSEPKNAENTCNFLLEHPGIFEMKTDPFSAFGIKESKINKEIKHIELDRISVPNIEVLFLLIPKKLESLILVKCYSATMGTFLAKMTKKFENLKVLQLLGTMLQNGFFNTLDLVSIERLDLSCCTYRGILKYVKIKEMKALKELKLDYCHINYKVVEALIRTESLEVISIKEFVFKNIDGFNVCLNKQNNYRCLDVSWCIFEHLFTEIFFKDLNVETLILANIKNLQTIIIILSQNSLYISVKCLSLSGNLLFVGIFACLDKFEKLEFLNISNLDKESIYFKISDVDFPSLSLDIDSNRILNEKKTKTILELPPSYGKERNPSNFDFITGFLECLCATGLSTSLRGINLSKNELDSANILRIEWLVNLNYLIVSFNDKIFSGFLKEYGALKFSNLETLILVSTNINNDIYHFVMTLPLLRNFETRECKFVEDILVSNLNLYPMVLEKIVFTNTIYSSYFKSVLEEMHAKRINVIVN
ncbi:hypothetical protein CWI37_0057p0030 [Hamiltosporidium tvaerminnensis]|uniref:Uncharacterized protein n=1 Tax=Hamiltosporidium tvaerminnensis TaxID=1176355 RepID=A0A4V2JVQ7_9MICR|nr:hypothetical protein CWI37_0057p0030 [Hamiltosporidium tvaerminnensis]